MDGPEGAALYMDLEGSEPARSPSPASTSRSPAPQRPEVALHGFGHDAAKDGGRAASPSCTPAAHAVDGLRSANGVAYGSSSSNGVPADVHAQIQKLTSQLEAARKRAEDAEKKVIWWEEFASRILSIFLLGPEMTENYKRLVEREISRALIGIEVIEEVTNLRCSFPAVPSEVPIPRFRRWDGRLSGSNAWDVHWTSAAWSVSLSVSGRLYGLGFSLALRLHHFNIRGRIVVAFPLADGGDLSEIHASFAEAPEIDFTLDSTVAFGMVPLPIQSQVDARARSAISEVLRKEMVAPNRLELKINALGRKSFLTDQDVQQAINDAELARESARRSSR